MTTTRLLIVVLFVVVGGVVSQQQDSASSSVVDDNNDDNDSSQSSSSVFTPTVTAICTRTKIIITTQTNEPFFGVVTSRGLRNNTACFKEGNGATTTVLEIDSSSTPAPSDPDYCRVSTNPTTSEKSVQISVRQHKTLELAHDKNYLVSCNKLTSSSPPLTPLPATLYLSTSSSGPNLKEVINARAYKLILKTNHPHYQIKNCVAFGSHSDSATTFFDSLGCPVSRITSKWTSLTPTTSETNIFQMFRFQDNNQVTLQCTVTFCQQGPPCTTPTPTCNNDVTTDDLFYHPTNPQPLINSTSSSVIASTTVNVLNPGDPLSHPLNLDDGSVCTGRFCPLWLLYLAITLGVLFLLMLLVNLCLCTALTCTCTRTELIEKDPSILEDYDPYNNSQHHQRAWEPYSTSNKPFTESLASADHYATPNNNGGGRPDSRFSQHKK